MFTCVEVCGWSFEHTIGYGCDDYCCEQVWECSILLLAFLLLQHWRETYTAPITIDDQYFSLQLVKIAFKH